MNSETENMTNQEYEINLLKRINDFVVNKGSINTYFQAGQYSRWTSQQLFLLSQIKEYNKNTSFEEYKRLRTPRLSSWGPIILFNGIVFVVTLIAIVSAMLRRPQVVLFCSDFLKQGSNRNPRLFNVLTFIQNKEIRYVEIIHVTTMRNFFINIWKRRRLGIYGESISLLSSFVCPFHKKTLLRDMDWNSFIGEESERRFIQYIIGEAEMNIIQSKMSAKILSIIFKVVGIKKFISIDDPRHLDNLLYACEDARVPSYIFQHSNFDYRIGLDSLPPEQYIFPDNFFTWNKYWLQRTPEISPLYLLHASRLKIGGRPYAFTPPKQVERVKTISDDYITVLIPYEVALQREYIKPYIDLLLNDPRIRVFFVLRGDFEREIQITQYFGTSTFNHPQLNIIGPQDKEKAISQTDVVVGVYSGFLDESVEMGIPVCILKTPYKNINRLDLDNLASLVDSHDCDIFEKLNAVRKTPQGVLQERKIRISENPGDIEVCLRDIVGL